MENKKNSLLDLYYKKYIFEKENKKIKTNTHLLWAI